MTRTDRVLAAPFLLVQIGDYGGQLYDDWPLPKQLLPVAKRRARQRGGGYPTSRRLPPPGFRVPTDLQGILMLKMDELAENGIAYWAQTLTTRIHCRACVNSEPAEIWAFAKESDSVNAVFVVKSVSSPPKGSPPGTVFERWTPEGWRREAPTGCIDTDIVYTETGKSTLVFDSLSALKRPLSINLNHYHVYFARGSRRMSGKKICYPYRSSMYGTCSLLKRGAPARDTEVPPLRPERASRTIVALGRLHPHLCGRVRG